MLEKVFHLSVFSRIWDECAAFNSYGRHFVGIPYGFLSILTSTDQDFEFKSFWCLWFCRSSFVLRLKIFRREFFWKVILGLDHSWSSSQPSDFNQTFFKYFKNHQKNQMQNQFDLRYFCPRNSIRKNQNFIFALNKSYIKTMEKVLLWPTAKSFLYWFWNDFLIKFSRGLEWRFERSIFSRSSCLLKTYNFEFIRIWKQLVDWSLKSFTFTGF